MAKNNEADKNFKVVLQNRKARHDYTIEETIEVGLMLTGTEVKSLRAGGGSIKESYAGPKHETFYLFNSFIPEYQQAGKHLQHEPKRIRKLLLNKKEISRLIGLIKQEGVTLVPLTLYFNHRGIAKLSLALVKGKKQHDKRETIKQRDWDRQKARILKGSN